MDSVLQAIGQELRAERERNLISLAELARTTRIPLRNLELLEEGRSEELPGPVFIKGFLRAYYKALGLDPEPGIARYERSRSPEPESVPAPVSLAPGQDHSSRFGMAIVVVILLILFTLALSIVLQPRRRTTPVELSRVDQIDHGDAFGSTPAPEHVLPV